jgi:hypothetical protein
MINALVIAAMLAVPATQTAPRCVTKTQMSDAAIVFAPYMVEALAETCRAHLPPEAFLVKNSGTLLARLKAESVGHEASAATAFIATMGADAPPMKEPEAFIKVMGSMTSGMMAQSIAPESCGEISGMVEALAPLPAANIGMFAASLATLVSKSQGTKNKAKSGAKGFDNLEICKSE